MPEIYFYTTSKPRRLIVDRTEAALIDEPCAMYFDDKQFLKTDWSKEPTESLKEVYRQRAQSIRDRYEYVIVAYSGGIDSTVVLESFLLNGIKVDEILVVGALSQDSASGVDENHNGELYANVFPTLKRLNLGGAKVTVKDYTELFSDPKNLPVIAEYGQEWHRGMGSMTSLHNFFWRDLPRFIEMPKKKTAVVFGVDKPNFTWLSDTKQCYTWFHDSNVCSYYFRDTEGLERVNFYWDGADTAPLRKQLHTIKQFYADFVVSGKLDSGSFYRNKAAIIEGLIYQPENKLAFKSPKSPTKLLSLRDSYILKKKDSEIYRVFAGGLKILTAKIKPEWHKNWNVQPLQTQMYRLFELR